MKKKKKAVSVKDMGISPEIYKAIVEIVNERTGGFSSLSKEIASLAAMVKDLVKAQARTEKRIDSLAVKMEELAEAQKRTEKRVEELTQAQARTEKRIDSLAVKMEELAEAQKNTEAAVAKLTLTTAKHTDQIEKLQTSVGGIGRSMGYSLENESYRALPAILKQRFGIEMKERLLRQEVRFSDGSEGEINIIGRALDRKGKDVLVLGEVASRLDRKHVGDLLEKSRKLSGDFPQNHFLVMVTHFCKGPVAAHAAKNKIHVIFTYEF